MTNHVKNTLYHGLLGFITGDAMGVPVEFYLRSELEADPVTSFREYGTHSQPAGSWSDDSSMTIATIAAMTKILRKQPDAKDVLLKHSPILAKAVMNEFLRWMEEGIYACGGKVFDIGMTITQVLKEYQISRNIFTCGSTGEDDNGNGALMRMLPLAIYLSEIYANDHPISKDEKVILNYIYLLCGITHNQERCKLACLIYVNSVLTLISNPGIKLKTVLRRGFMESSNTYVKYAAEFHMSGSEVSHYRNIDKIIAGEYKLSDIKSSGYVIDTLESVYWCLLNTSSFAECILTAVNLGDDTDTIAAIAGSIAGIYYEQESDKNYKGIPDQWIYELRDLSKINKIISDFTAVL